MANEAYYQPSDDDFRLAIEATEREIFDEATGTDELDGTEARTLADLSQSEGWDGGALPDSEIAARTMQGDPGGVNFDRPLQMETETTLAADNYALRQQLDAVAKAYQDHVQTPQQQAARQQQREQVRQALYDQYGMIDSYDDAKTDRFIADHAAPVQHAQTLETNRIEASMQAAHRKYGRDFEDAFSDVTSMNENSPLARQIVQTMCSTSDPGEALMELHGNGLVRSLGQPPSRVPFMHSGYTPAPFMPPSRPRRSSAYMDGGWGDESVEREVFDYGAAPDDEGWQY
jgi:hypothetical protein